MIRRWLLLVLILIADTSGCGSERPAAVVRAFFDAQRAHEVEPVMELLADDFVFRDREATFSVPRSRIRPMLAWDAATRWRGDVSVLETVGDTVRVRVVEDNDFLELTGLGPLTHDVTFVVSDGRIRESIVPSDPELQEAVDEALAPVLAWARETRPDDLDGLLGDAGIIYDGRSARGWVSLLREARRAGVIE